MTALSPDTPVIVAARRTPIGTAGHAFAGVGAEWLAAPVLRAVLDDVGLRPDQVDDVVLGNCMGPGGNLARVAALAADLPAAVPGMTVDRQCASGLAAVGVAATQVRAGRGEVYLAGGAESASTAPVRSWQPAASGLEPQPYARAPMVPSTYPDPDMGTAADELARRAGIGRDEQDDYALRSHHRAAAAARSGRFDAELVPLAKVRADERPRATLTAARLARLRPAFVPAADGGSVTAGNSCGISDGAAVVLVVPERLRAAHGWPGLRLLDWDCVGVDPALPGLGASAAIRRVLGRQRRHLDEVGAIEIVEAFAAQVLAAAADLEVPPERICTDGGAIALGHPWGASAAVGLVRLFSQLVRDPASSGTAEARLGVAAAAAGGGLGMAALVEAVRP